MELKNSPVKKSNIPNDIIRLLQKKKSCQFKDFKDILQISGPTLSIHLKSLISGDMIKFEKKGREKHYSLSSNASKIFESQVAMLSIMLTSIYDVAPSNFESLSELLHYITHNTGLIFLFTLLQSIKTGKNWTESFDSDMLFEEAADLLVYGLFEKDIDVEKLRLDIHNNPDLFLQKVYKLSKNKKNGPLIDELLELLEEQDSVLFGQLKELFQFSMEEYDS